MEEDHRGDGATFFPVKPCDFPRIPGNLIVMDIIVNIEPLARVGIGVDKEERLHQAAVAVAYFD